MVIKAVGPAQAIMNGSELSDAALFAQYKELIRTQDQKLKEYEANIASLTREKIELSATLDRVTNENTLLRAMSQVNSGPEGHLEIISELERWKEECRLRDNRINQLVSHAHFWGGNLCIVLLTGGKYLLSSRNQFTSFNSIIKGKKISYV